MRPFRRIFALLPLFAFSFPAFAAPQSSPQSTVQSSIQSQESQPLAAAARELARKVAASVGAAIQGRLTVAANFVNLSSLSSFEFQKACGAFHDEIEQQTQAFHVASSQE